MDAVERELETLRYALTRDDFAAASASARRYTRLVESAVTSLAPAQAGRLMDDSCRTLEWARRELCASRARMAQRLAAVEAASRYCAATPSPPHWKLTA